MTPESQHRVDAIESWFRAHEDGDFALRRNDRDPIQSGDHFNARTIIYTTKPRCLARIDGIWDLPDSVAIIGQYGLPISPDLKCLVGTSESCNRLFIGDADPPNILIYAWLHEFVSITWFGVNDDFLDRHGNLQNKVILIPLSNAETKAIELLTEVCPDYRDLLGEYCSTLLDLGFKIELEGAIIKRGPATNSQTGPEQNIGT